MTHFQAAIFDLDGVLVDSARAHYVAWKRVADELGIAFDEQANEALKGVDRMGSLDLILRRGGLDLPLAEREAI
ncbi:HAD hydrolase-like protein, partial [Acinetobacter baumannii]